MRIYDSLSGQLKNFKPLEKDRVRLYVCGITPYDTTHLGHAFTYMSFDALVRYLKWSGLEVNYTQNITDINDRDKDILQRAKEQNISWLDLANFWTEKFLCDMKLLNWTPPTHLIKASESLGPMINMVQKLVDAGKAYRGKNGIYLDVSQFPHYGELSKFIQAEMIQVARNFEEDLENPDKRQPLDVTLWRGSGPDQEAHIPEFASPWGSGRPGWHIECSAMATDTLGEQIDIHGGGKDLVFPHHEDEIIQSEGASGKRPFAGIWMHTGIVKYRGEKMSKSKGNLVMISELLKTYSANAIRWMLLSHHWREDWEFIEEDLVTAEKRVKQVQTTLKEGDIKQFIAAMENDLNTPEVIAQLVVSPNRRIFEMLGFTIS
jgi:cysteinyl-tRNA synthetase